MIEHSNFLRTMSDWSLLAQGVPHVDGHYLLLLTSRLLHILGAIILVGGVFYLRNVIASRAAAADNAGADPWFAGGRGTWAKWVGITTLVLLATGLFNFVMNVKTYEIATSYHMLVGIKILVALVVFFLAAVLAGRSALAERFRGNMKFWLSACLVAGIVTVLIGSVMRTYPRELKPTPGPTLVSPRN
jgi:uncharacterized membrane protein